MPFPGWVNGWVGGWVGVLITVRVMWVVTGGLVNFEKIEGDYWDAPAIQGTCQRVSEHGASPLKPKATTEHAKPVDHCLSCVYPGCTYTTC
jgi:hypothetical protein